MAQCYICGIKLKRKVNWTKDHIPPDGFFPPNMDAITVPCCSFHQKEYKQIDETMRNHMVSLIPDRSITPVDKGWRAVLGSRKLKKEYLAQTRVHPTMKLDDGTPRLIYSFNKPVLDKWLIRIVKGLYFYENKKILPEKAIFRPMVHYDILPPPSLSFKMERGLERRPYFYYNCQKVGSNPDVYFWGFVFYDKLLFSVEVGMPE